jgi:hypothetical protein
VAVDKTPARSAAAALERRDVGNSVPAGAQFAAALPQTATPAELLRWLGVIALALGIAGLPITRAALSGSANMESETSQRISTTGLTSSRKSFIE